MGNSPGIGGQGISGSTRLLGVVGQPVSHSLSPAMHNAALAHLGLDYVYLPLPVAEADLAAAMAGFAALGVAGFNVTIPHKQGVMALVQSVTPEAAAVGAVNTVWPTAEGWRGTNTDVAGFVAPLRTLDRPWGGTRAVVLGNGGAARAVVAGCSQLGMAAIQVVGRTPQRLAQFAASWQESPLLPPLTVHPFTELPALLPTADLVVNTTPVGMYPHSADTPIDGAQLALLPAAAVVYDLIYRPRPTQLLALAAAMGYTPIDGTEMLVQQGAAALEIWLDQPAPVAVMRDALLAQLGN